ncbi:MAG: hypothetical protein ABI565_13820 [Vicinamibacteria bacterium]
MNEDFDDLLRCLLDEEARFLIVGAHAMAAHGVPRATGDIDVWIATDDLNVGRVFRALAKFGAPLGSMGVSPSDFLAPDLVVQVGIPPRRIDILTGISGVTFDAAWDRRDLFPFVGRSVPVLGRDDLMTNKRAAGRPKDIADIAALTAKAK